MHTIPVSDDVYETIATEATARNLPIDELLLRAVNQFRSSTPLPLTGDDWQRAFDAFNREIQQTVDRYPADFQLDIRRDAIYEDHLRAKS